MNNAHVITEVRNEWVTNETECMFYISCNVTGDVQCERDPMIYIPFGKHHHDINCQRAQGVLFGTAERDETEGALCMDGDGGYLSVSSL